jgi:hypothetical protein
MLDDAYQAVTEYKHECDGLWFGFLRKLYGVERSIEHV